MKGFFNSVPLELGCSFQEKPEKWNVTILLPLRSCRVPLMLSVTQGAAEKTSSGNGGSLKPTTGLAFQYEQGLWVCMSCQGFHKTQFGAFLLFASPGWA